MSINIERLVFPTFLFFMFVKAFSGPIGMVAPFVNYSAVGIMLLLLVNQWVRNMLNIHSVMILSCIFILYILLGILNSGLVQTLFGVYIFIPFLFSVTFSGLIFNRLIYSANKYFLFFAASGIMGIMYVNAFGAPWLGSVLDIGGYSKVLSRDWTAGGALRDPGFTGASFDAATLLLICSFFILYNLKSQSHWFRYLVVIVLPIYPIYLTTTKTTILTYVILAFVTLLPSMAVTIFTRISIAFSVLFSYFFMLPSDGYQEFDQSNTFLQRMYETWPKAIGLLTDNYSYLIGKGIGGIGTPSLLFSPRFYNPADNALVYLYVMGGAISVVLVAIFMFKFLFCTFEDKYESNAYYLLAFCIFTGGVTYNLFESVFYAPFAGVLVGVIFNADFCSLKKYSLNQSEELTVV